MNPSFMAMMSGMMKRPGPKKGKVETSINGRAFAPGKGVQQEASGPEKEAKIDCHLAQLRKDVAERTGVLAGNGYQREGYPRSDMVEAMEEAQEAAQCA